MREESKERSDAAMVLLPRRRAVTLGAAAAAAAFTGAIGVDPRAAAAQPTGHVVLLGDSIFDNKSFVAGGPDVAAHLRARLPAGWRCTLAAVNGAVTADVPRQLLRAPHDASHLVISAGGNDALRQEASVLNEPARTVADALARLAQVRERFQQEYRTMLDAVAQQAPSAPLAVCTIYDPRFLDPARQRAAVTGLALFNDVIVREAFARGLALLDLRLVCDAPGDLANPIEPSVQGGGKIAAAIAGLVTQQRRPVRGRPEVVTGGG